MSSQKENILVLGATGGCALSFLIKALEAEYNCTALVRTESKLIALLSTRNVPSTLVQKHLTIITGDVKDPVVLSKVLFLPSGHPVDIIVSGIGSYPVFTPNPLRPTLQDPKVCEEATAAVLKALHTGLKPNSKKPLMVVFSTTGISDKGRDIPLAMVPLYHWMLPIPHADKKKMENLIVAEVQKPDSALSSFVVVRSSLLTDGAEFGVDRVRADFERDGGVAKDAVGYTISRNDVGNWVFVNVLVGRDGRREKFANKLVSITY